MPKTTKPPSANQELFPAENAPKDFEGAMRELEQLVENLEAGQLSLEESLAAYKRGMLLSQYCQRTLDEAELQVKVLENGVLKDFDPEKRDA